MQSHVGVFRQARPVVPIRPFWAWNLGRNGPRYKINGHSRADFVTDGTLPPYDSEILVTCEPECRGPGLIATRARSVSASALTPH
eukprot:3668798-Rhodomonas_salina.1